MTLRKKSDEFRTFFLVCGLFLGLANSTAFAEILDFNSFTVGPEASVVTINPAGTTATLTESNNFNVSVLSLDPFFGDPDLIQEYDGSVLQFDYEFLFGPNDQNDQFEVNLFDADIGVFGGSLFSEQITSPQTGSIIVELSSFVGLTLGIEFRLQGPGGDVNKGSSVTLSNLEVTDAPPPSGAEIVSVPMLPLHLNLVLLLAFALVVNRYRGCND